MKRYLSILLSIIAFGFTSCDYNEENFSGLDESSRPANVAQYQYEITTADIAAISAALFAKKNHNDSVMANALKNDNLFSDAAPASTLIPILLASKYYTADKGSSVNVTYQYKQGRTEELQKLSQAAYVLNTADYQSVWGTDYVDALTPEQSPSTKIPSVLAANFPNAVDGDFKIVEYNYSGNEPVVDQVGFDYFFADFEGASSGSGVPVSLDGWLNVDLKGTRVWECRVFNGNQYAQVTANNSGSENENWLITPQLDLTEAVSPNFTFDITAGYFNEAALSILVSENFTGTQANITTASWTNVTSMFTLPDGPASGYGTLSNAGNMDFSAYAGKKVYVAFVYNGDGRTDANPKKTTTYQIDNVKISGVKTAMSVESTKQNAVFQFTSGKWSLAGNTLAILQPEDYTAMGISYMNAATAANNLPVYLAGKFPYAQNATVKTVVYKNASGNSYYADEYTLTERIWTPNSFITTNTDQFIFSGFDVSGWIFDPTLTITMEKVDYQLLVDYVKQNFAGKTPALIHANNNAEYYYGASAYYGNMSMREVDRLRDPDFATLITQEEKDAYLKQRTEEGLGIYLSLKFPDATPQVAGIDVFAFVNTAIYNGASTILVTYKYQCVGANPSQWVVLID